MKRFAQLIAMLLCLAMVLTACGGDGNNSSGSTTTDGSQSTTSGDAERFDC